MVNERIRKERKMTPKTSLFSMNNIISSCSSQRENGRSVSDKGEPFLPWEGWVWKLLELEGSLAGMANEQTSVTKCAMGDTAKAVSADTALPGPSDSSCQESLNNAVLRLCSWLFTERWGRADPFSAPFLMGHAFPQLHQQQLCEMTRVTKQRRHSLWPKPAVKSDQIFRPVL